MTLADVVPNWHGEIVTILATGPMLDWEQVNAVRAAGCRVIAIKQAIEMCPWADWLHSGTSPGTMVRAYPKAELADVLAPSVVLGRGPGSDR